VISSVEFGVLRSMHGRLQTPEHFRPPSINSAARPNGGSPVQNAMNAQSDGTMRVLWVTFVGAIGVVLIGAILVLNSPSGGPVENPTQTTHSATTGSAFDK
jgi:hypothetical protein